MKKIILKILTCIFVVLFAIPQLFAQVHAGDVIHIFREFNQYDTITITKDTRIEFESKPYFCDIDVYSVHVTEVYFGCLSYGVQEIAYKVVRGTSITEKPSPEDIFAEAEEIVPGHDGDMMFSVDGFEGGSDYVVYFAVKTTQGTYLLQTCNVTTRPYTELLTIINTTPVSVKFHVNMPEETDWLFFLDDRVTYQQMKQYYGWSDKDFFESVGCVHHKGPQTIEIKNGDYWYTETDWDGSAMGEMLYSFKPSTSYVMMVSAAYWGEDSNGGRWIPYYESTNDEGIQFTREYATEFFKTNPAMLPAEGEGVEVTLKELTESTAYFEIIPSESCLGYHVLTLTSGDYYGLASFLGEDGMQAYTLEWGEPMIGANEYVISGLSVGTYYHIMVTGLFEENGAVQSFYHDTFSPQESTLPLPVLEVTSVDEKNTHDKVYFNVKCTTKDAAVGKYVANYVKDWIPELNAGYSYDDMVEMYGLEFTEEELAQVNSDAGYELCYTSYEDVATRLAVVVGNADEKICEAVWADSKAGPLPAKEKVESSLYADLEGDWVLNYWDTQSYLSAENSDITQKYRQFQTTITTNPDFGPASYNAWKGDASYEFVLNALGGNTTRVKNLFNEYKTVAAYHKEKYAGQNQIVGVNFPCGYYTKAEKQNVYTPWDLFTSEYYSAYDNFELFYDFGPKVFFEVKDANTIVLKSDMSALPPLENFDGAYYMVGIGKKGSTNQYLLSCEFPVTISDDKNTLTVHPVEYNGILYYPGTIQYYNGNAYPQNVTPKELVYTRGTLDATTRVAAKCVSIADEINTSKAVYSAGEPIALKLATPVKRVAKFSTLPKINRVKGQLFDVKANFEKNRK